MQLKIEIEGVDRTNLIEADSFNLQQVKTSQVDTVNFTYKKIGDETWTPQREQEIVVTDEDTSTVLFGGRLVDIALELDKAGTVYFDVKCIDYTHDLNDELVAKTYENQSIHNIIDDFLPEGFTSENVIPIEPISNLEAHWKFDEGTGTVALDSSGNGHNGTITNGVYVPGFRKDGLYFAGDGYVSMGNIFNFERTDHFSVSTWIKCDALGIYQIFGKMKNVADYPGYELSTRVDGSLTFVMISTWQTDCILLTVTPPNYADGNFHHIVFTYNGNSNASGVKIYFDGTLLTNTVITNALSSSIITDSPFEVGRRNLGENFFFTGILDEVRVFSKVLTQAEVLILNGEGGTIIERIQFNYQTKADCLKDLADLGLYDWYVDPLKDVHFFEKEGEMSPFNISETSPELIGGTLQLDLQNSGMKNSVYVKGGEYVGDVRTESIKTDGVQTQVVLANKFSALPVVTVDGVPQDVGISYINQIGDTYDCLWSFQEKYIDFGTTPLAANKTVAVTGLPLIPLIMKKNDRESVRTYGIKEYMINDVNIKDPETAKKRAIAELGAYKDGIIDGSFMTYTSGLRAGQTIHIDSPSLGVDDDFIINSLSMKRHGRNGAVYTVKIVAQKTVGIIEFLQYLLKQSDKKLATDKQEIINIAREIAETRDVDERIRKNPFTIDWVWGYHFPVDDADQRRTGRWTTGLPWA